MGRSTQIACWEHHGIQFSHSPLACNLSEESKHRDKDGASQLVQRVKNPLKFEIATKAAVLRQDGQLDNTMRCGVSNCSTRPGMLAAACWPEDLIHDLRWIDAQAGSPERLFTVATVKVGPHTGLRAVGIATNQKRLKSASNLALAFAGKLFQLFFVTLACTCFSFLHVGAPAKGCLEIVQNIRWLSARTTATHSAPLRGTTMW